MVQSAKKVAAWLVAHPKLLPEDVLATAGPWPSLETGDYLVWAREQEDYPPEAIKLVEQLWRECLWAYDNWAKASNGDAQKLIIDLLHNCQGADQYQFTSKFLREYAQAHGYFAAQVEEEAPPPWRKASEGGEAVPVGRAPSAISTSSTEPPPALPKEKKK